MSLARFRGLKRQSKVHASEQPAASASATAQGPTREQPSPPMSSLRTDAEAYYGQRAPLAMTERTPYAQRAAPIGFAFPAQPQPQLQPYQVTPAPRPHAHPGPYPAPPAPHVASINPSTHTIRTDANPIFHPVLNSIDAGNTAIHNHINQTYSATTNGIDEVKGRVSNIEGTVKDLAAVVKASKEATERSNKLIEALIKLNQQMARRYIEMEARIGTNEAGDHRSIMQQLKNIEFVAGDAWERRKDPTAGGTGEIVSLIDEPTPNATAEPSKTQTANASDTPIDVDAVSDVEEAHAESSMVGVDGPSEADRIQPQLQIDTTNLSGNPSPHISLSPGPQTPMELEYPPDDGEPTPPAHVSSQVVEQQPRFPAQEPRQSASSPQPTKLPSPPPRTPCTQTDPDRRPFSRVDWSGENLDLGASPTAVTAVFRPDTSSSVIKSTKTYSPRPPVDGSVALLRLETLGEASFTGEEGSVVAVPSVMASTPQVVPVVRRPTVSPLPSPDTSRSASPVPVPVLVGVDEDAEGQESESGGDILEQSLGGLGEESEERGENHEDDEDVEMGGVVGPSTSEEEVTVNVLGGTMQLGGGPEVAQGESEEQAQANSETNQAGNQGLADSSMESREIEIGDAKEVDGQQEEDRSMDVEPELLEEMEEEEEEEEDGKEQDDQELADVPTQGPSKVSDADDGMAGGGEELLSKTISLESVEKSGEGDGVDIPVDSAVVVPEEHEGEEVEDPLFLAGSDMDLPDVSELREGPINADKGKGKAEEAEDKEQEEKQEQNKGSSPLRLGVAGSDFDMEALSDVEEQSEFAKAIWLSMQLPTPSPARAKPFSPAPSTPKSSLSGVRLGSAKRVNLSTVKKSKSNRSEERLRTPFGSPSALKHVRSTSSVVSSSSSVSNPSPLKNSIFAQSTPRAGSSTNSKTGSSTTLIAKSGLEVTPLAFNRGLSFGSPAGSSSDRQQPQEEDSNEGVQAPQKRPSPVKLRPSLSLNTTPVSVSRTSTPRTAHRKGSSPVPETPTSPLQRDGKSLPPSSPSPPPTLLTPADLPTAEPLTSQPTRPTSPQSVASALQKTASFSASQLELLPPPPSSPFCYPEYNGGVGEQNEGGDGHGQGERDEEFAEMSEMLDEQVASVEDEMRDALVRSFEDEEEEEGSVRNGDETMQQDLDADAGDDDEGRTFGNENGEREFTEENGVVPQVSAADADADNDQPSIAVLDQGGESDEDDEDELASLPPAGVAVPGQSDDDEPPLPEPRRAKDPLSTFDEPQGNTFEQAEKLERGGGNGKGPEPAKSTINPTTPPSRKEPPAASNRLVSDDDDDDPPLPPTPPKRKKPGYSELRSPSRNVESPPPPPRPEPQKSAPQTPIFNFVSPMPTPNRPSSVVSNRPSTPLRKSKIDQTIKPASTSSATKRMENHPASRTMINSPARTPQQIPSLRKMMDSAQARNQAAKAKGKARIKTPPNADVIEISSSPEESPRVVMQAKIAKTKKHLIKVKEEKKAGTAPSSSSSLATGGSKFKSSRTSTSSKPKVKAAPVFGGLIDLTSDCEDNDKPAGPFSDPEPDIDSDDSAEIVYKAPRKRMPDAGSSAAAGSSQVPGGAAPSKPKLFDRMKSGESAATTRVIRRKRGDDDDDKRPLKRARQASTPIIQTMKTKPVVGKAVGGSSVGSSSEKGKGKRSPRDDDSDQGNIEVKREKISKKTMPPPNIGGKPSKSDVGKSFSSLKSGLGTSGTSSSTKASSSGSVKPSNRHSTQTPSEMGERARTVDLTAEKVKWPRALKNKSPPESVQCDQCKGWFHHGCAGLKDDDPRLDDGEKYTCPPCEAGVNQSILSDEEQEKGICGRPNCKNPEPKQGTFFVEGLVGRKYNPTGKGYLYLVKWDGYPMEESTWESGAGLAAASIEDFVNKANAQGKHLNDPFLTIMLQEAG